VAVGDAILALPSSGVHSNGFSLVRRIFANAGLSWDTDFGGQRLADVLMEPTRIYVKPVLALHRAGLLKAAAHITGGGLPGNLPRVLPEGLGADLGGPWAMPPIFRYLARAGGVAGAEMLRVFNCGVGMACVVTDAEAAQVVLRAEGEKPFLLGQIAAEPGVRIAGLERLFD
jgi:phosphoribosylformylglycinamidine cyclo-ligase